MLLPFPIAIRGMPLSLQSSVHVMMTQQWLFFMITTFIRWLFSCVKFLYFCDVRMVWTFLTLARTDFNAFNRQFAIDSTCCLKLRGTTMRVLCRTILPLVRISPPTGKYWTVSLLFQSPTRMQCLTPESSLSWCECFCCESHILLCNVLYPPPLLVVPTNSSG